jgi:3D (Asp-Asp-Asp) domain-containing protein
MSRKSKHLIGFLTFLLVVVGLISPFSNIAEEAIKPPLGQTLQEINDNLPILIQGNSVISLAKHHYPLDKPKRRILVMVTGYSSSPFETDETPYITASGTLVKDGIVAANFLPFGTKIRIPEIFGEKVFVVEDRMNPRKGYHIDIWFPTREKALKFGARLAYIEIVE